MNGIIISVANATEEGIFNEKSYPTIEEEMENVKKLT
jgi:hypothetical protein